MLSLSSSGSHVPLYHRVFAILRQRINDGAYSTGQQLPTEDELAVEFGVSRATIRQAVGDLVNQGLVLRQQGRGTFVTERALYPAGQRFRGALADLISETKRTGITQVEISRSTQLPHGVAARLELSAGRGTIIRRIRTIDGGVFAYTVNHMSDEVGRLFTESHLRKRSLMAMLEGSNVKLTGAVQSIHAQLADLTIGERLGLDFGDPVLFVERLLYGARRHPVQLAQSWYRGDRYEYTVTLETGSRPGTRLGAQFA